MPLSLYPTTHHLFTPIGLPEAQARFKRRWDRYQPGARLYTREACDGKFVDLLWLDPVTGILRYQTTEIATQCRENCRDPATMSG